MQLLTNERRYATWTVMSKTALGSTPEVAYRRFGDSAWTWVPTTWSSADTINADGYHVRTCSALFCGPDATGASASVLIPGRYETQIRYTDAVEVIAAETAEIKVLEI
jgi:hypothetical protein